MRDLLLSLSSDIRQEPTSTTTFSIHAPKMGPSDKRLLTQISVLALAGAKSPNKVTEHAVLFDSLGSTPKTDASTKKTVGSREGASESSTGTEKASSRTIRSAISGPLQLQRGNLHGRSMSRSRTLNSVVRWKWLFEWPLLLSSFI